MVKSFETMCAQADSFADCFYLLYNQDESDFFKYSNPLVVNDVFACELYLKALLFKLDGKHEKIHTLDELFYKLPQQMQQQINAQVIAETGKDCDSWKRPYIETIANAFVDWRYICERQRGSMTAPIGYIKALITALRKQCNNLKYRYPNQQQV